MSSIDTGVAPDRATKTAEDKPDSSFFSSAANSNKTICGKTAQLLAHQQEAKEAANIIMEQEMNTLTYNLQIVREENNQLVEYV